MTAAIQNGSVTEISDEDWEATHASINSARCYEVAIAALRERWLQDQKERSHDQDDYPPGNPAGDPERGER
jgi:hypothetical protein